MVADFVTNRKNFGWLGRGVARWLRPDRQEEHVLDGSATAPSAPPIDAFKTDPEPLLRDGIAEDPLANAERDDSAATEADEHEATLRDLAAAKVLVVGQPGRALAPFADHFGSDARQRPASFTPDHFGHELDHLDVAVYLRDAQVRAWVSGELGKAMRVFDRIPVDYPLMLTTSDVHIPAFGIHRVRVEAGRVVYSAEQDIDALSAAERRSLRAEGKRIRPYVQRLQTVRRIARFNKVEIGRKFGPLGHPRILVLGREEDNPDFLVTNPDNVGDTDVVRAALKADPAARILFMPGKKARADTKLMKSVKDLGNRVQIVDAPIAIGEFAHLVGEVHTVDSQLGAFAIAHGMSVTVYGRPHYAGLGVTRDVDADGRQRSLRVAEAIDADTFVGWYLSKCVHFCDPLDGRRIDVETFATDWSPFLGELSDAVAERLVERALRPDTSPDDMLMLLRALARHGKTEQVDRLIAACEPSFLAAEHLVLAYEIAVTLAERGDWRRCVRWAHALWRRHGIEAQDKVFSLLVLARKSLGSISERGEFAPYVLGIFRSLPSVVVEQLGATFTERRFYRSALFFYSSCAQSISTTAAKARCHIGLGSIDEAQAIIDELCTKPKTEEIVEELNHLLLERREDYDVLIPLYEVRVRRHPSNFAQKLKLASFYREAGQFGEAIELLLPLIRSVHGHAALRMLAAIYVARMEIDRARGLLTAQIETMPTDPQAWKLLAEVHSFDNDLPKACDCLLEAIKLYPLDIGAHTRLTELEYELAKVEKLPSRWTERFDAFLEEVDQPTFDTMLAQGRARLQAHDFATIEKNCRRAMCLFPQETRSHVWYAHALAWEPCARSPESLEEIRRHYETALARDPDDNPWSILDAIRSLAKLGEIAAIEEFVEHYRVSLFVGDRMRLAVPRYSAAMALGDFAEAFDAMRHFARTKVLRRNSPAYKLALSLDEVSPHQNVLLLSEGGVGDELRYSTLYPELAERFEKVTVSVDERLLTLFQRSFPMIENFVALPRFHRKRLNRDHRAVMSDLPDAELAPFANNDVWKVATNDHVVLPVPCTLADLRRTPEDFAAGHDVRLRPREDLVEHWRERLEPYGDKLVVGVTWTSMFREYQRVENYLTHEEIGPLFLMKDVVFVNCQYENIDEELRWFRDNMDVEILDFPDLDKRDDFEGLAAMLVNLDLFVGTGTTTTEFAALLGVPTIYASPTALNAYRNPRGTEIDHFFPNMKMINPSPHWDRQSMMKRIEGHVSGARANKKRRLRRTLKRQAAG